MASVRPRTTAWSVSRRSVQRARLAQGMPLLSTKRMLVRACAVLEARVSRIARLRGHLERYATEHCLPGAEPSGSPSDRPLTSVLPLIVDRLGQTNPAARSAGEGNPVITLRIIVIIRSKRQPQNGNLLDYTCHNQGWKAAKEAYIRPDTDDKICERFFPAICEGHGGVLPPGSS